MGGESHPRILYPVTVSFKKEGKKKSFRLTTTEEIVTSRSAIHEKILKGALQAKRKQ